MANERYRTTRTLKEEPEDEPLSTGIYISRAAVAGKAAVLPDKDSKLGDNTIVVIREADNTWFPLIRQASAVIIEEGSIAQHFSQMLREMNMPSVICAKGATDKILDGQEITIHPGERIKSNFPQGYVREGIHELIETTERLPDYPKTKTEVFSICSFKGGIEKLKHSPMAGIGLMRADFLNNYLFGIHPLAMVDYANGTLIDNDARRALDKMFGDLGVTREKALDYYIDVVAKQIFEVAQHIPGKRINYRVFDLNSGESRKLIGGAMYELVENNPMMGERGVTKFISNSYRPALELECAIMNAAIEYGVNLHPIVPFCRTPEDGKEAIRLIREQGISKAEVGGMIELPINVILADRFADQFDYMVFGPMDMTQSLYMADRGTTSLSDYCNFDNDGTRESVNVMLRRLEGYSKDIFIIAYEVFSGLGDFMKYQGDNRLHLISFPDNFEDNIFRLSKLEERVEYKK